MAAIISRFACGVLSLLLLLLLFVQTAVADAATVTVTDYPGFTGQRNCAQFCGWNKYGAPFGCPSPVVNGCFCRPDLMSSAARSIASCVSSSCQGNGIDIASATSIYSAYCSQNGYTMAVQTAAPGSGSGSGSGSEAGSGAGANAPTPAQGAGSAVQTSGGTNNGNSGAAGNGCGNQVANASGINIVCGAKGDAGALATNPRWLALGVSLTAWFVV
ncbi:hypothetical protein NEMBOFW57_003535 [Staphylotrichum longicolle]|uniref:CFEM domain-containing protein n=1 Tax=Staphylotrichum longicolle TaxID=669026 RepID=A0AAD4F676_9PEZI|nr:hypothetical protein NEMBOFW57_003535 [Staphylotrichum longicolle]